MKKITLLFTLFFAVFTMAQTTLVQYQFEGNANPYGVPIGNPTLVFAPATAFAYTVSGNGNPLQALSTVVDNKSSQRYLKLEISTADYNSISISFDHWTNTSNGKPSWTVYANTTGAMYTAGDQIASASAVNSSWITYSALLGSVFNNSVSKITVYLVAANATGNTSELRMDNLKITGCKISPPPAPAAPAAQIFCAGATVSNLSATVLEGHTLSWYTSGGALLAPGTLLSNGTTYYAVQTDACGKPSAQTPVTATVNPILTANVSISANTGTTVCAGTSVTFTANPVNGGTAPTYQWQVNGVNVPGATSPVFTTSSLANNSQVRVIMTSNASPCLTGSPATSNTVTMTINPPVSAGTLSYSSNSICIGGTATYSSNGTAGGTWSSNNTNVATVNNAGVVTGIAPGTATITYTLNSGCGTPVSASAGITVNPDVNAGTLSYSNNQVCVDGSVNYASNGTPGGTWTSSNPAVATVGINGAVTGVSPGTAVITYTLTGCSGPKSVSEPVTVKAVPNANVTLAGNGQVCTGGTAVFNLTGTPGNIITYTINGGATTEITLSDTGTSQVVIPNAASDQTFTLVSVYNGACTNPLSASVTAQVGKTSVYSNGTWSNGLPISGVNAVIATSYSTADGNIVACNCEVQTNATLTVSPNTSAVIENNIINNGQIIIESDGNLIQRNDGGTYSGAGNAFKARRYVTGVRNSFATGMSMDYIYWSAPVTGQGLKAFSPGTPSNRIYQYNETNDYFNAVNLTAEPNFKPAKGYALRAEDGLPYGYSKTYEFTGTPNNGIKTIGIQRSPDAGTVQHGYNLIGNPYPSNIDFDQLYAANSANIYKTVWFWVNDSNVYYQTGSGYTGNGYAVYNGTGGNGGTTDSNPNNGIAPDGIVKVGQGFIVQMKNPPATNPPALATVTFNNSMRVSTPGTFYSKGGEGKDRFWLKLVSPASTVNTQLIGYVDGATNEYEQDFDAEAMSLSSDLFYSKLGDRRLVIQGKSNFTNTDRVILGANVFQEGTYTIALKNVEGVFAGAQDIYLKDNLLNTYTNLKERSYSFTASKGISEGRFEIVYTPETKLATGTTGAEDLKVYRDANDFVVVSSGKKITGLELYDSAGRLVYTSQPNQAEMRINASTLTHGVYVLKIDRNGTVVSKKVMK